jgi:hypothetical protein
LQQKIALATIAILGTALFSATLAMTIHAASAQGCSPRNPKGCAAIEDDFTVGTTTVNHIISGHSNTAMSVFLSGGCVYKNGQRIGPAC